MVQGGSKLELRGSYTGDGVNKPETTPKPRRRRRGPKRTKKELLADVIGMIEKRIDADELNPTVGDFIRLVQLEREIEQEQPKEIKVSWIDPSESETKDAGSGE